MPAAQLVASEPDLTAVTVAGAGAGVDGRCRLHLGGADDGDLPTGRSPHFVSGRGGGWEGIFEPTRVRQRACGRRRPTGTVPRVVAAVGSLLTVVRAHLSHLRADQACFNGRVPHMKPCTCVQCHRCWRWPWCSRTLLALVVIIAGGVAVAVAMVVSLSKIYKVGEQLLPIFSFFLSF